MDLDGLYLPLSFFLHLLADAYGDAALIVTRNPRQIVSVNLNHPKIKFHNMPDGGWSRTHWEQQKEEAKTWQLASIKFLRNFEEIVRELLYK